LALGSRDAGAEPTAADKETARSLLNTGDRKRDANDLQGALKAYRAADAIMGVPTTAIEVAKVEERLGLLVEARDSVLRVTRFPVSSNEPRAFQQARSTGERLAADLSSRIPSIQVKVRGAPLDDVTLEFDGALVPKAAASMARKVNPGQHSVIASAQGYLRATAKVVIAERETREIELRLWPAPSNASAQALPNNAIAPAEPVATPPPPTVVTSDDRPRGAPIGPLVYVGASVAAVGITVGTVAGLAVFGRKAEANKPCEQPAQPGCIGERTSTRQDAYRLATVSNISFGIGALGAAVTIFALMRSNRGQPHGTSDVSLDLMVKPGAAAIAGTF
jgi:hypothetical protein